MAMEWLGVCLEVMRTVPSREWTVDSIVKEVVKNKNNQGKTPEELDDIFGRILNQNAQTNKPLVIKPSNKRGGKKSKTYKLNSAGREKLKPNIATFPDDLPTQLVGAAGEHATAAFLLFSGYNVSRPSADVGVDLIAEKGSKYWAIQVKTTFLREDKAKFKIEKDAFERTEKLGMLYVFVIKTLEGNGLDFIILPYHKIAESKSMQPYAAKNKTIVVTVEKKAGRYYFDGADVNYYTNAFDKVEKL